MAVLPDGKILVAGTTVRANGDFLVLRYTSAGVLDPSFGAAGRVTTDVRTATNDVARSVAVLPDGKVLVGGSSAGDFALVRYLPDGALDATFGTGGRVTTDRGSTEEGRSLAVLPDGAVIVAGRWFSPAEGRWAVAVARYLPNGTLDTSFGTNGWALTGTWNVDFYANSVAIQPDGKIVVAGYARQFSTSDLLVLRYSSSGALDSSFGTGGIVRTAVFSPDIDGNTVALQPDGKIVVGGSQSPGNFGAPALVRYSASGVVDSTFSMTPTGWSQSFARVRAISIQSDGSLVVTGSVTYSPGPGVFEPATLFFLRFGPTGVRDFDFQASSNAASGEAMAMQPDGKFVVAGISASTLDTDVAVFRFDTNASRDPSFGDGGVVFTDVPFNREDRGRAVARQSDGRLIVAGHFDRGNNWDWGLVRYLAAGAVDTTFGGGRVTTAIGASFDFCESVAVQPDGRILAAGRSWNGSNYDFAIARYSSTGSLDVATFGNAGWSTDGIETTPVGTGGDGAFKILVQSDGKVLVAGYANDGSNADFALVRYTSSGALDSSFGVGGRVITAIGAGTDIGLTMALQSDGRILVGGYSHNGTDEDFALVRYDTAGALDPTFGTGGKVMTPVGAGSDSASVIAVQSDGKILLGGYATNGSREDAAIVRYTSSGVLDSTFGSGGKVIAAFGTASSQMTGLAVQSDGRIVAVGSVFGASDDALLLRYTSSGALDPTFGTAGRAASVFGSVSDRANGVLIQPDGKIVVAGRAIIDGNWDFAIARYDATGTPTVPPSLNSPLSSTIVSSPITISFSLPVTAAPDSLQLRFEGVETRVLTLASAQLAAGPRTFLLNPANPTSSTAVASGSSIPDGIYWVTLSYRDTFGNPAATATAANVRLDTTAFARRRLAELGDPTAGDFSDPDADGIATLAEYGLVLPLGTPSVLPAPEVAVYPEGRRLRLLLQRDPARSDVTIRVRAASSPAGPWTTIATSSLGQPFSGPGYVAGDSFGSGIKNVEVRDMVNLTDAPRRFLRVFVTR